MLGILKYTTEPLVPKPSAFRVELDIKKLKRHKSPGIDQIPSKLIKAGGSTTRYEIHKLIISIWYKEELSEEWKESIVLSLILRVIKQTVVMIEAYHIFQLHTTCYPTSCCQGLLHM